MRHGGSSMQECPHYEVTNTEGKLKSILMVIIPHKNQRYDTVGDWIEPSPGQRMISVSDCGNEDSELLVGMHEIFEQHLCKKHGITQAQVDKWDMSFTGEGEPGEDPNCPYYQQHQDSTAVEKLACDLLGMSWENHERNLGVTNGSHSLPG